MTKTQHRRLATAAACSSLFAFAALATVTPAALNNIGRFYRASDTTLGLLFLIQSLGFIVMVILGGRLSDRWRKLPVLLIGCLTQAVGAFIFWNTSDLSVAATAMVIMGAGGGLTEGIAMAVVSELYTGDRRTSMLNASQVFFAIGAVTAPLVVSRLISLDMDWRLGYLWSGMACVVAGLIVISAMMTGREKSMAEHRHEHHWKTLVTDPLVIALSAGILLYVSAECGQANWLAVYFKKSLGSAEWLGAVSVSFFWGGIGLGRATAATVSRRIPNITTIIVSLALATLCQTALLLIPHPAIALGAVLLLGFCLGPVWPTILGTAGTAYPRQSGTLFGLLVGMGCAGIAIFPPLIGRLADLWGIRAPLWGCVGLLLINLVIFVRLRRRLHDHGHLSGVDIA